MHYPTKKAVITGTVSALALAVASSAGAFEVSAKDTTAKVYGYAKLDMIYDVNDDLGPLVTHKNIRLDNQDGPDGHTRLQAFQSRLGVSTLTPTDMGDIKTVFEGDFYGDGGGVFRLRHAYGEWHGILAGQTWSNFGNFLGTTPTIDFLGQVGQPVISRQSQLRYTTGGLSVALEDPGTLGGASTLPPAQGNTPVNASTQKSLPDLTAQFQGSAGMVTYGLSGMARRISVYDAGTDNDESAFGYGVSLAAKIAVSDMVTLHGSVVYGDGIGGYLYGNPGAPAYYNPQTGNVETIKAMGGTLGGTIAMGPGDLSLAYGIATADWDSARDDGVVTNSQNETFQSTYINYIWSPVSHVSYGVEAGYHTRKTVGGDEGNAVRIQGMAQYSF